MTQQTHLVFDMFGTRVQGTRNVDAQRIRCRHIPHDANALELGHLLLRHAQQNDVERLSVWAFDRHRPGLRRHGFVQEAFLPHFYGEGTHLAMMGRALRPTRKGLAHPRQVRDVDLVLDRAAQRPRPPRQQSRPATTADAKRVAAFLADVHRAAGAPDDDLVPMVRHVMKSGDVSLVERDGDIDAVLLTRLDDKRRAAELIGAGIKPSAYGRGCFSSLVEDLEQRLTLRCYRTLFALVAARVPVVNVQLQRLGFGFRGTLQQECVFAGEVEDMNVWSKRLPSASSIETTAASIVPPEPRALAAPLLERP